MKRGLRLGLSFGLGLGALSLPAAGSAAQPAQLSTATLVCEAVYAPARTVWTRRVEIGYDQQRVRSVHIDGISVYTFSIRGTLILTALDNERIQVDTAGLTWSSDFRGLASAKGRCERG
jgi:hypothetical protein